MTLLQFAVEKYRMIVKTSFNRELAENEVRSFEAGWSACVVEYRKAEEEETPGDSQGEP